MRRRWAASFTHPPCAPRLLLATKICHFWSCFGSCSAANHRNIESASDIETRIYKLQFGPGPRSQLAIALELFDLQNRHIDTIWTEKSENDENSSPDRFRSSPGQEIKPRSRNSESQHLKTIHNSENEKIKKNTPKPQDSSIFRLQICIFALLTQQII